MRTTLSRNKGRWAGFADGGFPPRRRSVQDPAVRLDSRHSFSFSPHYDPLNTYHGLLLVNNDDVVRPGTGDQSERHVVVAVRRKVTSQPFDPFHGLTGDREPLANLRCGQLQCTLDLSATKSVDDRPYFCIVNPMPPNELGCH
jgi:hypothetical protein